MELGQSGLEDHPAGAGDINAVIIANWATIEEWGNPLGDVTLTQSGTTITASADVFFDDQDWVGAKIYLKAATPVLLTVASRTSNTVVEVTSSATVASPTNALAWNVGNDPMSALWRMMSKLVVEPPDGANLSYNATTKRGDVTGQNHVATVDTTDATLTDCLAVALEDDQAAHVRVRVVAIRTNGSDAAAYDGTAICTRGTGAASAAVAGASVSAVNETDASWDVSIVADTTGGGFKVQVQGAGSKNVSWKAVAETLRV